MCGRFELKADKEYLEKIFKKGKKKLNVNYDPLIIMKQENIAPTDKIMVIVHKDDDYELKVMKWAIRSQVPNPSKQNMPGFFPEMEFIEKDIFNSRVETVRNSSQWRSLILNNRCIVPMTAFYEWPMINGKKQAQRIFIENQELFFAGGIYMNQDLKNETGASILTCDPNKFMKSIHNRMPVIFDFEIADEYLRSPKEVVFSLCEPLDDKNKMSMENANI